VSEPDRDPASVTVGPLCVDLAAWTFSFSGDTLLDLARSRARAAIRDVIGCIIAGAQESPVLAAMNTVSVWEGGRSYCVGYSNAVPSPLAALVNGTAAHALDYDDNFFPAITHASAVLIPALLAYGDEIDASWNDVIEAYIVGLEVQARLGRVANPRHYESGWHATSTLGAIGAAAACAKLAKLSQQQTAWAISLGASFAGGSKLQFGTAAKPVHAGAAAMHGVLAARLASCGVDASIHIFEGPWGFFAHHAAARTEAAVAPGRLAIETEGLVAKLYPSCMSSHLGIDALLLLRQQNQFALEDIDTVELAMPRFMVENLRFTEPKTLTEARFSMNYCAAVALIDGPPTLAHFTQASLDRPDIRTLASRVRMTVRIPDTEVARLPWGGDACARVVLRDGRVMETRVSDPKGSSTNPLTPVEAGKKFRDCCHLSLGSAHFDRLSRMLDGSIRNVTVKDITALLAKARDPIGFASSEEVSTSPHLLFID